MPVIQQDSAFADHYGDEATWITPNKLALQIGKGKDIYLPSFKKYHPEV